MISSATFDAESAENAQDIEQQFAVKSVEHLLTYWRILEAVPGSSLKLTGMDDEIHEHFTTEFPEFDPSAPIDEDSMKSKAGKEKWRSFIQKYKGKIDDFNFGTILRSRPNIEYTENDSIFVVRMQFYAIEIARNRAGLNDWVHKTASQRKKAKENRP